MIGQHPAIRPAGDNPRIDMRLRGWSAPQAAPWCGVPQVVRNAASGLETAVKWVMIIEIWYKAERCFR